MSKAARILTTEQRAKAIAEIVKEWDSTNLFKDFKDAAHVESYLMGINDAMLIGIGKRVGYAVLTY